METNLEKIKKLAKLKDEENQEFIFFLKGCNHHLIDRIVHQLNKKYMKEIDCKECANCCEKLIPALSLEETENIADYLNLRYEDFKEKYIEREIASGYILKGNTCPFLQDKKCSIYDCRPEVCKSFPHLHKDNINHRLINIIDNSYLCPIIFNILEDLKNQLWDKDTAKKVPSQ